jgi:hypothetical protein
MCIEVHPPAAVRALGTSAGGMRRRRIFGFGAALLAARFDAAARAASVGAPGIPAGPMATRVPGPMRLSFTMRSGLLSGTAELAFEREGDLYTLDLRGRALGMEIMHLSSRGRIGPQGFEPERYIDQRISRPARVADFDRAAGRVRYSGSALTHDLAPGLQDRLSWMLQLSGLMESGHAPRMAGSQLSLPVSGARTDMDIWQFTVHGLEPVVIEGRARAQALRLSRTPQQARDTEVEIWLDPGRGFLPVRARLTTVPDGDTLELSLRA